MHSKGMVCHGVGVLPRGIFEIWQDFLVSVIFKIKWLGGKSTLRHLVLEIRRGLLCSIWGEIPDRMGIYPSPRFKMLPLTVTFSHSKFCFYRPSPTHPFHFLPNISTGANGCVKIRLGVYNLCSDNQTYGITYNWGVGMQHFRWKF